MTNAWLLVLAAFLVGIALGDSIGFRRHATLLDRAVKAGRIRLTVSRQLLRQVERRRTQASRRGEQKGAQ